MQIKTQMIYQLTPITMHISRRLEKANGSGVMVRKELSSTVGGNVLYSASLESNMESLQKVKIELPNGPVIPTSWYLLP